MKGYDEKDKGLRCVGSTLTDGIIRVEDVEREVGLLDIVEWFKQYIGSIKFSELLKLDLYELTNSSYHRHFISLSQVYSAFVRTYVDEDGRYVCDDENGYAYKYKDGKLVKKIVSSTNGVKTKISLYKYKKDKIIKYKFFKDEENIYRVKYGKQNSTVTLVKKLDDQRYTVKVSTYSNSTKLQIGVTNYITDNVKKLGDPIYIITLERDKFGNIINAKKIETDKEEELVQVIYGDIVLPIVDVLGYCCKNKSGEVDVKIVKDAKVFILYTSEGINVKLKCEE